MGPTKPASLVVLAVGLLLSASACHLLQYRGPKAPLNGGPSLSIEGSPRWDTNQVMLAASAVAESHKRDIRDYVCQFVGFAGNSTDANISNKWILRFEHKERWHNYGFFIVIDDATGETSWQIAD